MQESEALDPANPEDWRNIAENSALNYKEICEEHGLRYGQFLSWKNRRSLPKNENREAMESAMKKTLEGPQRIPKHPSYGFALPEEIKRLDEIGICDERKRIFDRIAARTKAQGKGKR